MIDVHIEAVDQHYLRVSLQNRSNGPVSFLSWGSPFESSLSHNLFRVEQPGSKVPAAFVGRHVKRIDALPEDFTELGAGDSIETLIPLARYYELPSTGVYTIQLSWMVQVLGTTVVNSVPVTSNTIEASLSKPPSAVAALPSDFSSCSASQQTALQQAVDAAENLSTVARNGLMSLSDDSRYNSPRYKQWFGAYSEARFAKVRNTYVELVEAIGTQTLQFNCGCNTEGWFAYVYPSLEYRIYICPAFWEADLLGRDSRAGTIIHELTHFPSVAGTKDHAYSTATVALARDNPNLAVDNADNYEYFAENDPALAIFNGVEFSWLRVGIEVSGSLLAGQSSFYKVADINLVELTSDSGDSDLHIYGTPAAEEAVCTSMSNDIIDSCGSSTESITYIEVTAVSDTNFRLLAREVPVVAVQGEETNSKTNGGTGSASGMFWVVALCWLRCRYRRRVRFV